MSDAIRPRTTVSASGTATLRLRPALLLMLLRVRAAEATLELGLAAAKRQCEDAARRLTRLGATSVKAGEPHEDGLAEADPVAKMRAAAVPRLRRPAGDPLPQRRGVNVTLTATWDLAGKSAEEVLMLVDQLRFDAADPDPPAPPDEPPPWAGPEEQLRTMMAQALEPADDAAPKFLFVARPGDELLARTLEDAYSAARLQAERLACAAGRRLGELVYLNGDPKWNESRSDRMMERQRCDALIGASSYEPKRWDYVSEDARAVEATLTVHANYHLE